MAEANDLEGVDDMAGDNSENDQGHLHCVACKGVFEHVEYYRCSCSSVNWKESGFDEFYCDVCIGPHIRQKHEVLDYKGYKPAICSTHEVISTLFCYDCDKLFCFKCLGPHRKHDYRPVSEKAQEVKRSVFEYLNQFDELAKPLARRKSFVENCVQRCEELYPNMCTENFIDDLCNRFERVLRSNASKWQEIVESQLKNLCHRDNIFDIMDRADTEVVKLRQLLSMSDSVCVSTFLGDDTAVKASLEQKSELDKCQLAEWCRDLDCMIEEWVKNLLEAWNIPAVKREDASIIECHEIGESMSFEVEYDLVFDLKVTATSVCFKTLEDITPESDDENDPELRISKHHFDIPDVVTVHRCCNGYTAFVTSENRILIYDLETKSQVGMACLDEHVELLNFQHQHVDGFRFIVWNSEKSVIQFLGGNLVDEEVPCESKPKIVEYESDILAFVEMDNKLTIVVLNQNQLRIEVLPHHHGLNQINRLRLSFPT